MSIRIRFIAIIGILSLIAALCLAFISYRFNVNHAMNEAKNSGSIIFNYIDSSRSYFREHQRPLILGLVDEDRFFPEIMSGFAMTRGVWDEFAKKTPDYVFKQATIDPLFPANKADAEELEIIDYFDKNPTIKTTDGIIEKNGESFLYFARPIMMKKGCLRCHGDPADAPKDQAEIYGLTNGYNWKVGDVLASFIVYVPIQKALDSAKKSAAILFGLGMAGIIVLMIVIWVCLDRYVLSPVQVLQDRTSKISLGTTMEESIKAVNDDEIGSLAQAINRLRVSMLKMLERCQKQ